MLILCFAAVLLGIYDTASDVAFVAHIQWTCKSTLFSCRVCVDCVLTERQAAASPSLLRSPPPSTTVAIIDHEWVGISAHGQCAVGRHCGYCLWDWDGHTGLILVCRLAHLFCHALKRVVSPRYLIYICGLHRTSMIGSRKNCSSPRLRSTWFTEHLLNLCFELFWGRRLGCVGFALFCGVREPFFFLAG